MIGLKYITDPVHDLTPPDPSPARTGQTFVTGTVTDHRGRPLTGYRLSVAAAGGLMVRPTTIQESTYHAWTDQPPGQVLLIIEKAGYKTQSHTFEKLAAGGDITLTPGVSALPALAAGALLLLVTRRKRAARTGAITTGQVLPFILIGAAVLGFDLIRKILEALGIWEDREGKGLDQELADPRSAWNPGYWQAKPAGTPWTYQLTTSQAEAIAVKIYNAFGPFNDCEECASGAIKNNVRTKANVSFVADIFYKKYRKDLLEFLRGGWWPQDRLSDADVHALVQFVNRLPNY